MKDNIEITEDMLSEYLAGEASPEDAMLIEDWAAKSDTNRMLLESCYRIFYLPEKIHSLSDNQSAWGKIVGGIEKYENSMRTRVLGWYIGIAASIALLIFIGIILNYSNKKTHDLVYYTNSDAKKIHLNDAVEITLEPNSALTVNKDFDKSNRKMKLSGSAVFSVRHNNSLPLIIDMNGFYVQDLGTKFTIGSSANADTVSVLVQEGKVSAYDMLGSKVIINAHEQAFYIRSAKKLAMSTNNGFTLKLPVPNGASNRQVTSLDTANQKPKDVPSDTSKLIQPQRSLLPDPASQTKPNVLSVDIPLNLLPKPDIGSGRNLLNSICDCDDTPPFKRFEKLDINALSQAEYNQPDLLVKALQSGNVEKRAMAVRQLGKLQLDKYLNDILRMMSDKDCIVRVEVVNALTKFRSDNIGKALILNIRDASCFVREEIAGELKKYNALNGVESALLTLSKDNSANVATQALNSLRYYKDDELGKELLSHLHDKDEHPKTAAIYALKNFRADSIAVLLTAELNDQDKHVRQAAAEALKYYNSRISRPALLGRLKADTNEHVQLAIIESLAAVGDDSAIDPLIAFVNDKRNIIRQLTIRALGVIGNKKVIPYIETASHDENSFVREEANEALKKLSKN